MAAVPGPLNSIVRAHLNRLPFIAGITGAVIAALFALPVIVTGEVYVPGKVGLSGYYTGVVAYLMAAAWLCLAASSAFAGAMLAFPERYFQHRHMRDVSFLLFGAFFVLAVVGGVAKRLGWWNDALYQFAGGSCGQRGRAVLAINCVVAGAERAQCLAAQLGR
jgi:hypothetical protein